MVVLFASAPGCLRPWRRGLLRAARCGVFAGRPVRVCGAPRRRVHVRACADAPAEPEPLYLVDAMGLVYRGYHALSHATMSSRALRDTRAVYGFALVLLSLARGHARGARLAVVFEGASAAWPDFRKRIFPDYKATRPRAPEGIRNAVPWVKDLVRALGCAVVEVPAYEADDVIGTLVRLATEARFAREIVIVSTDKDFRQLLRSDDPPVRILKPVNSRRASPPAAAGNGGASHEFMDEDDFRAAFNGVAPPRYVDVLALLGDKSDNVPGVPGIGSKTAPKLVSQFGSLEALLNAVDDVDVTSLPGLPSRLVKVLRENADLARLSAHLVSIKDDVHMPDFSLAELRRRPVDRMALARLVEQLDFDRLMLKKMLGLNDDRPLSDLTELERSRQDDSGRRRPGVVDGKRDFVLRRGAHTPQVGDQVRRRLVLPSPADKSYLSLAPEDIDASAYLNESNARTGVEFIHALVDSCRSTSGRRLGIAVVPGKKLLPAGLALSAQPGVALCIEFPSDDIRLPPSLADLLLDPDVTKYGWHMKEACSALGARISGPLFDIRIARDLLFAGESMTDRRFLERYFGEHALKGGSIVEENGKNVGMPRDNGLALSMADMACRLSDALHSDLELSGVARVAHEIEFPLIPVLADMERVGVPFSVDGLSGIQRRVDDEIEALEEQLMSFVPDVAEDASAADDSDAKDDDSEDAKDDDSVLSDSSLEVSDVSNEREEASSRKRKTEVAKRPKKFNLGSRDDIAHLLFTRWQIPVKGKTEGGRPATDKRVLVAIAGDTSLPEAHRAFASLLLKYREASKVASTYTRSLAKAVGPDGRIHATFVQDSSASGRLSTSKPNLQSMPTRSVIGRELRATVAAGEGRRIICADYSQIELRILAAMSGDRAMLGAFSSGEDIHASIAQRIYKLPAGTAPTAEQRSRAKAVSFGVPYGISAHGLAQQLSVDRRTAQELIAGFRGAYPRVHALTEVLVSSAKECGAAHTLHGRRLALPLLTRGGRSERAAAARVAVNMPIQGTQADMLKLALAGVWRALRAARLDAHIVLAVHDEIVVDTAAADAPRARDIVAREMAHALPLPGVDAAVSVGIGDSWRDAAANAAIVAVDPAEEASAAGSSA